MCCIHYWYRARYFICFWSRPLNNIIGSIVFFTCSKYYPCIFWRVRFTAVYCYLMLPLLCSYACAVYYSLVFCIKALLLRLCSSYLCCLTHESLLHNDVSVFSVNSYLSSEACISVCLYWSFIYIALHFYSSTCILAIFCCLDTFSHAAASLLLATRVRSLITVHWHLSFCWLSASCALTCCTNRCFILSLIRWSRSCCLDACSLAS